MVYPAAGQFDGVMGPDGEGPGLKPSTAVSSNAAASPVTANLPGQYAASGFPGAGNVQASAPATGEMRLSLGGGRGGNKTPKPIDKSNWNRGTKVSQGTVDAVKDLGRGNMGANAAKDAFALKPRLQGGVLSSGPAAASVEQKEATKRVYPNAYKNALINSGDADRAKAGGARSMNPPLAQNKVNIPAGETRPRAKNFAGTPSNVKPWNDRFAATIVNAGQTGLEAYTPFRFNRV